jgi:hypothetical protein
VLLDQSPALRASPGGRRLWVVKEEGGLRVRYLRLGGTRIYIANEATVDDPQRWLSVPLKGRNILDIVRARVVWVGRELDSLAPEREEHPERSHEKSHREQPDEYLDEQPGAHPFLPSSS